MSADNPNPFTHSIPDMMAPATMSLEHLRELLAAAWCAQTSSDPAWTPANPALGQCAVTALVVQDQFGGELLRSLVHLPDGQQVSHYFNRIDGEDVDLTRGQFPQGSTMSAGAPKRDEFTSTRQRVLSFPDTQQRYALLQARIVELQMKALDLDPSERTHKQAIVLRKDLGMRAGKMIAQGAHASMKAVLDQAQRKLVDGRPSLVVALDDPRVGPWLAGRFAKIGLRVESEQELLALVESARAQGLIATLITDAGLTEFNGVPTNTAVAIGPDVKSKVDPVTQHLKLL